MTRWAAAALLLFASCSRSGFPETDDLSACSCPDARCLSDAAPDATPDSAPEAALDLPEPDIAADLHQPDTVYIDRYLKFDDKTESVRLDNSLDVWKADFTASVEVRLDAAPGNYNDFLISFSHDPNTHTLSGWELGFESSGKLRWWVVDQDNDPFNGKCSKYSSQTLPLGKWLLVTFVFDYTSSTIAQYKIYVDDQLWVDMSSPGTSLSSCNATLAPGPLPAAALWLGGMDSIKLAADDLRVFDRALSAAEVALLLAGTVPSGQVLHLAMDEGQGSILNDSSGNGLTATAQNPDWQTH